MVMANMINTIDSEVNILDDVECQYYVPHEFKCNFSNNIDTFSVLHLNARSLNRNFDSVKDLLLSLDYPFTVIGITESWLTTHSPPLFDLDGYQTIRVDR